MFLPGFPGRFLLFFAEDATINGCRLCALWDWDSSSDVFVDMLESFFRAVKELENQWIKRFQNNARNGKYLLIDIYNNANWGLENMTPRKSSSYQKTISKPAVHACILKFMVPFDLYYLSFCNLWAQEEALEHCINTLRGLYKH